MLRGRKSTVWILPDSLEPDPLTADITAAFSTVNEPVRESAGTWFDSFDWRLFQRGFFLYQDEHGWNLLRKDTGETIASLEAEKYVGPVFARDFPACRIRSILEPVLDLRSLLPLATRRTRTTCLRILNRDDKTVARVFLEEHAIPEHREVLRTVRLEGVRGYAGDFRKLAGFFNKYGIGRAADAFYPFIRGAELGGRKPLDYSSKFTVPLKPQSSAQEAMIAVYRQLLDTMRRNEAGILDDLDSEFLHDFRVAVRRTRSGLGQVKNVLPPAVAGRTKKDFSWLGSITGPTRDLDVYLLNEQDYRSRLPAGLQKGLDVFFAEMKERRAAEHRKLVRHMQSERYGKILAGWQAYLFSGERTGESENGGRPVKDLAGEIIIRDYRKVMKKGAAITLSSPDGHLHRLRIECKKLRYVLEFFASLFPPKQMKRVIKLLKLLQDNLGCFNDLSVQQDMLRTYQRTLRPGSRRNQDLAAAIGGLLTNLHHEQQQVRREFAARFEEFSGTGNVRLYTKLFDLKT